MNNTGDERAIAPIVAVVLLLFVSVLLVGIASTYIFSSGEDLSETAPQTTVGFNPTGGGNVQILHTGGTGISGENTAKIEVYVDNEKKETFDIGNNVVFNSNNQVIGTVSGLNNGTAIFQVVWVSPEQGNSETLAEERVKVLN